MYICVCVCVSLFCYYIDSSHVLLNISTLSQTSNRPSSCPVIFYFFYIEDAVYLCVMYCICIYFTRDRLIFFIILCIIIIIFKKRVIRNIRLFYTTKNLMANGRRIRVYCIYSVYVVSLIILLLLLLFFNMIYFRQFIYLIKTY